MTLLPPALGFLYETSQIHLSGDGMPNLAILIGNSKYDRLEDLECCHDDLCAMNELIVATEKFEDVILIENASADTAKSRIRAALDAIDSPDELFIYFSGHGHIHENEFYHCATNFDVQRPNETGLSTTELHTLIKPFGSGLVVKVIDACYSGTNLIKSDRMWLPLSKNGFKNIIQIASSLDTQTSLTGNPLSVFTRSFRDSAVRKIEGPVFYTDIINTLRDTFIGNDAQTPHFISQGTGREQFVDDAKLLDPIRQYIEEMRLAEERADTDHAEDANRSSATLLERLEAAESKIVTAELMSQFVNGFLDNVVSKLSGKNFKDFYDSDVTYHQDFSESITERFIIRVLKKEDRSDNFVTAEHERKLKNPNPLASQLILKQYLDDDAYVESWFLSLNCRMEKAQIKIALTPKYNNLLQIVSVVTCAPSLHCCYVFELTTSNKLHDFGKYDRSGKEISRRWWKLSWRESTDGVARQIAEKFDEATQAQLQEVEARLSKDS